MSRMRRWAKQLLASSAVKRRMEQLVQDVHVVEVTSEESDDIVCREDRRERKEEREERGKKREEMGKRRDERREERRVERGEAALCRAKHRGRHAHHDLAPCHIRAPSMTYSSTINDILVHHHLAPASALRAPKA